MTNDFWPVSFINELVLNTIIVYGIMNNFISCWNEETSGY